jgi:thioredoxin 2
MSETEQEPAAAILHGIRSIPTLVLFAGSKEIRRTSGAMDQRRILAWARG